MDTGTSLDSLEKIDVGKKYPWISKRIKDVKNSRVEKSMKRTFGFMKVLQPEFQFKDKTMSHLAKQLEFCDGCAYHEDIEQSRSVEEEIEPLERFVDLDAMKIEDANSQASSADQQGIGKENICQITKDLLGPGEASTARDRSSIRSKIQPSCLGSRRPSKGGQILPVQKSILS